MNVSLYFPSGIPPTCYSNYSSTHVIVMQKNHPVSKLVSSSKFTSFSSIQAPSRATNTFRAGKRLRTWGAMMGVVPCKSWLGLLNLWLWPRQPLSALVSLIQGCAHTKPKQWAVCGYNLAKTHRSPVTIELGVPSSTRKHSTWGLLNLWSGPCPEPRQLPLALPWGG